MIKLNIILLFVFGSYFCNAQGIDNLWLLGYYSSQPSPFGPSTMDFKNGSPLIYRDTARTMNFDFLETSMSDSTGNILFYTNGVYIVDKTNQTMVNGNGINPSSSTT